MDDCYKMKISGHLVISGILLVLLMLMFSSLVEANTAVVGVQKHARIFHFVLRGVELNDAKKMVHDAQKAGFNAVQVLLTDGVKLNHSVWKKRPDAWSREDFIDWVNVVQGAGLDIIPELKLLTHQEKFFQNRYPGAMFNHVTYDPRYEDIYSKIYLLLDEIAELVNPKAIHIGHDEVAGYNLKSKKKWLKSGQEMLPADLFLKDILKIHDYLKARGIETWIWGDMLISTVEFPNMLPQHLHGDAKGYGKELRNRLPRDIVICDWHYFDGQADFPSLAVLNKEGFKVIGVTWKKEQTIRNFSRYAANHGALGMMATTWFYVQRKEWNTVNRILRVSGRVFSQDFPDAQ